MLVHNKTSLLIPQYPYTLQAAYANKNFCPNYDLANISTAISLVMFFQGGTQVV